MINEQNQDLNSQNQLQNQGQRKQNREEKLKIVFGIIFGALVLGLAGYLIAFLITNDVEFKNYISLKKDKKIEEVKVNEQKVNANENTAVNENVNLNESKDVTSDWLEFDVQGISFLYPEVLEQSRKVRQIDIPGERKYDFYNFGVFGVGVLKNDANLSLKNFVNVYFDQESLLILENVKIGKDQKINALKVTVTDEYDEKFGILGIKYFFANNNKVYTISPGQAFPTLEAENYYTENNIKYMDALIESIQFKN